MNNTPHWPAPITWSFEPTENGKHTLKTSIVVSSIKKCEIEGLDCAYFTNSGNLIVPNADKEYTEKEVDLMQLTLEKSYCKAVDYAKQYCGWF